jgi:hypothetical protein
MTAPETFVSRWSRLKREAEKERNTNPTESAPPSDAVRTPAAGQGDAIVEGAEMNAPASRTFDPASLPPIESITVGTDIRSFLQSSVPADLTRAALRRAWVSDPAIRDFIGIAENQWDFTEPTAIPGFGPLRETDDVPRLLAQALGKLDRSSEVFEDKGVSAEGALSRTSDPRGDAIDDRARETPGISAVNPADTQASRSTHEKNKGGAAADDEGAAAGKEAPRHGRGHGGALPR